MIRRRDDVRTEFENEMRDYGIVPGSPNSQYDLDIARDSANGWMPMYGGLGAYYKNIHSGEKKLRPWRETEADRAIALFFAIFVTVCIYGLAVCIF
jgi:hypothetical protein